MLRVVARRVAIGIPVVVGVSLIVFLVLRVLPGNPVDILTQGAPTTPGELHNLTVEFGLNRSLLDQYWLFVWHALHGNFGVSFETRQPVTSMIAKQAAATVELAAAALALTAVFGTALGTLSARFRDSWVDSTIRVFSLLGTSMPTFLTGPLLILLFSFTFHLFPSTGSGSLAQLVLPAVSLAIVTSGFVVRLVRNSMVEVMGQEFVTALEARGANPLNIWIRHILRNALMPAVTILGVQLGGLLSGAVIVESIFSRQGLGTLLVNGISNKDYPMVQAIVLIVACAYVTINILVDISYAYLDPRVRTAMSRLR